MKVSLVAALFIVDSRDASSTQQQVFLITFPEFTAACRERDIIMCFPTMLSLWPFDKQHNMWSESAELNLVFVSAQIGIYSICMFAGSGSDCT